MTQQRTADRRLENIYLKIFKYGIVGLMTLTLVAVAVLLVMAGYQYSQAPIPPAPVKEPPQQSINMEDLKKYLTDEEKRRQEQEKNGGAPKPQPAAPAGVTQRYAEEALAIYRCSEEFARLAEQQMDSPSEEVIAQRKEAQRRQIENIAHGEYRGDAWVAAMKDFTCAVLKSPEMAKLKKDGKVGQVVWPTIMFHANVWTNIERKKEEFRRAEASRVEGQIATEELRIAGAKAKALFMLTAAGALVALLFMLALYLIFAKIEDNLRLIHHDLGREPQPA